MSALKTISNFLASWPQEDGSLKQDANQTISPGQVKLACSNCAGRERFQHCHNQRLKFTEEKKNLRLELEKKLKKQTKKKTQIASGHFFQNLFLQFQKYEPMFENP